MFNNPGSFTDDAGTNEKLVICCCPVLLGFVQLISPQSNSFTSNLELSSPYQYLTSSLLVSLLNIGSAPTLIVPFVLLIAVLSINVI